MVFVLWWTWSLHVLAFFGEFVKNYYTLFINANVGDDMHEVENIYRLSQMIFILIINL